MRREDGQRASADSIAIVAENARLVLGETGDAGAVLLVLSVAEEHSTGDLVLDCGAGLGKGVAHNRGALAVLRIIG